MIWYLTAVRPDSCATATHTRIVGPCEVPLCVKVYCRMFRRFWFIFRIRYSGRLGTDRGPGSVVGIATGYGLTFRGSNPVGDEIFRTSSDRPLGPPNLLHNGYRVFPGGKERPGLDADPSPLLVPWSWKDRAIPLLPLWAVRSVQSLSACTRVIFTLPFGLIDPEDEWKSINSYTVSHHRTLESLVIPLWEPKIYLVCKFLLWLYSVTLRSYVLSEFS